MMKTINTLLLTTAISSVAILANAQSRSSHSIQSTQSEGAAIKLVQAEDEPQLFRYKAGELHFLHEQDVDAYLNNKSLPRPHTSTAQLRIVSRQPVKLFSIKF